MKRSRLVAAAGALLLLPGGLLLARSGWMRAKGALGEALIERALDATLADGRAHRPWSWADLHPVARLTVPRLGVDQPVLSGATGNALAFGIGHVHGTAVPGEPGNCVLAGHRDTWAGFLAGLRPGDEVVIEAPDRRETYRVSSISVVRLDEGRILNDTVEDRLTLVTCWPLDGWLQASWRYVVSCRRVTSPKPAPRPV